MREWTVSQCSLKDKETFRDAGALSVQADAVPSHKVEVLKANYSLKQLLVSRVT